LNETRTFLTPSGQHSQIGRDDRGGVEIAHRGLGRVKGVTKIVRSA
jgi:hypothetical protein